MRPQMNTASFMLVAGPAFVFGSPFTLLLLRDAVVVGESFF